MKYLTFCLLIIITGCNDDSLLIKPEYNQEKKEGTMGSYRIEEDPTVCEKYSSFTSEVCRGLQKEFYITLENWVDLCGSYIYDGQYKIGLKNISSYQYNSLGYGDIVNGQMNWARTFDFPALPSDYSGDYQWQLIRTSDYKTIYLYPYVKTLDCTVLEPVEGAKIDITKPFVIKWDPEAFTKYGEVTIEVLSASTKELITRLSYDFPAEIGEFHLKDLSKLYGINQDVYLRLYDANNTKDIRIYYSKVFNIKDPQFVWNFDGNDASLFAGISYGNYYKYKTSPRGVKLGSYEHVINNVPANKTVSFTGWVGGENKSFQIPAKIKILFYAGNTLIGSKSIEGTNRYVYVAWSNKMPTTGDFKVKIYRPNRIDKEAYFDNFSISIY